MFLNYARKFHNDQNVRNLTHHDDEDETCSMQNVVLEENKSLNAPCFPCEHFWKKSYLTIQTAFQSEYNSS